MLKTIVYGTSVKGYKHLLNGTECQDRHSFVEGDFSDDEIKVVALSDGHGGSTYCRSAQGAAFAVEIAKREIRAFVGRMRNTLDEIDSLERLMNAFPKKFLLKVGEKLRISSEASLLKEEAQTLKSRVESELDTLKKAIILGWRAAVDRAFAKDPIELVVSKTHRLDSITQPPASCVRAQYGTAEERSVRLKSADLGDRVLTDLEKNPRILYGATLLAAAQYKEHLFLFALGDGDMLLLDEKGNVDIPLPKIKYQQDNATDSLCQKSALSHFQSRYLKRRIKMVMLSTDGVDNAFEEKNALADVARNLYESIDEEAEEYRAQLAAYLRRWAGAKGSGDDCTLCFIANGVKDEAYEIFKNTAEPSEAPEPDDVYCPLLEDYTLDRAVYAFEADAQSNVVSAVNFKAVGIAALRKSLLKDRYIELIEAKQQLEALSWQGRLLGDVLAYAKRCLKDEEASLKRAQEAAYLERLKETVAGAPLELIKFRTVTFSATEEGEIQRCEGKERNAIVLAKEDRVIEIVDITPQLYEHILREFEALVGLKNELSIVPGYKLSIDQYNFTIKKEN